MSETVIIELMDENDEEVSVVIYSGAVPPIGSEVRYVASTKREFDALPGEIIRMSGTVSKVEFEFRDGPAAVRTTASVSLSSCLVEGK